MSHFSQGLSPFRAYLVKSWGAGHRLFICQDDFAKPTPSGCTVRVVESFNTSEHQEGDGFDLAGGIGNADQLVQAILDTAWENGFRPRGFSDVKNETTAVKAHLQDMRVLAFHKIGANLKD